MSNRARAFLDELFDSVGDIGNGEVLRGELEGEDGIRLQGKFADGLHERVHGDRRDGVWHFFLADTTGVTGEKRGSGRKCDGLAVWCGRLLGETARHKDIAHSHGPPGLFQGDAGQRPALLRQAFPTIFLYFCGVGAPIHCRKSPSGFGTERDEAEFLQLRKHCQCVRRERVGVQSAVRRFFVGFGIGGTARRIHAAPATMLVVLPS